VLDLIRKHPDGLTTDEVEQILGLNHQTASPRMWELHKRSLIGDTGKRRKTRSGRLAAVYRALSDEEIEAKTRQAVALAQKSIKDAEAVTAEPVQPRIPPHLAWLFQKKGRPQ
jgi:predicted transcriptional regulator